MPLWEMPWLESFFVARLPKEEERVETEKFVCCRPMYVGKSILLCGRKQSVFPFQCMVGPDYPCMLVTYALIIVPTILFEVLVASKVHPLAVVLGLLSFVVTLTFFSLAACSDPGIVYRTVAPELSLQGVGDEEGGTIPCSRCDMPRPACASHCYDCEVCVKELDHHCPWVGKCIGERNLKFFYLFIAALTVHILFVGVLTGMHAITSAFKLTP